MSLQLHSDVLMPPRSTISARGQAIFKKTPEKGLAALGRFVDAAPELSLGRAWVFRHPYPSPSEMHSEEESPSRGKPSGHPLCKIPDKRSLSR